MIDSKRILVVDDNERNRKLLRDLLQVKGFDVETCEDGHAALESIERRPVDLVLLDIMMPGLNGFEVCERIRSQPATRLLPVVLVTALDAREDRIRGIECGADDFLTKPINTEELLARVSSLLRINQLHNTIQQQAAELQQWNNTLEKRVQAQVEQIGRLDRLKNFLPIKVAELALTPNGEHLLKPQRSPVTVCVIDLRGFTQFADQAAPEQVIQLLSEYFEAMGRIVESYGGTVERFVGDGMVVFFNVPIELDGPECSAVSAARDMQVEFKSLQAQWARRSFQLGLGIGVASGEATAGAIGYGGRWQYSAIGPVTNLAARLCGLAEHGQILTTDHVRTQLNGEYILNSLGDMELRGFSKPIAVHALVC